MATGTCSTKKPLIDEPKCADDELRKYESRVKKLQNIKQDEIKIEEKAAQGGSYGDVSFGKYRGKNVVKKDFKWNSTKRERLLNYREAWALANCNHTNIVQFIGAGPNTLKPDIRYIVIERATNASLAELIHSHKKYTFWHVMLWGLHLADGLEYLHKQKEPILHRDLKPANMLLYDGCTLLKITDFGTSKFYEAGNEDMQSVNQGSLLYMAPEVQNRTGYYRRYTGYTEKVDIYSLTVSLWEMLTRKLDPEVNPHQKTISGCPPFLQNLFKCGLSRDPKIRPSASQLVQMFDFIVRKVFGPDISQLCIDFCPKGELQSFHQQTRTYSTNTETNSTLTQSRETMTPRGIHGPETHTHTMVAAPGTVQAIGMRPFLSPQFARNPGAETRMNQTNIVHDRRIRDQELNHLALPPHHYIDERPIPPDQPTEAAADIYERHLQLVEDFPRLSEEIKMLNTECDGREMQIVNRQRIERSRFKDYEMTIKVCQEICVKKLHDTAEAMRKNVNQKKRNIFHAK